MENNLKLDIKHKSEFKRSLWWKIYFFFCVILVMFSILGVLINPKAGFIKSIGMIISLAMTVGLFGFVFLKPIYKPKFWLLVLIADIIFSIVFYFITDIDMKKDMSDTVYYVGNAIGWLLTLPGYYALYSYSKPSDPAWENL